MSSITVQQVCEPSFEASSNPKWRRAIVLPREHGAWGMLAIPLLSGTAIGYVAGGRAWSTLALAIAVAMAVFLARTPFEALLGVSIIRPNERERRIALSATCFWAVAALTALAAHVPIKPLLIPVGVAAPALLLQFSRRSRRGRLFSELLGAATLSGGAFLSYFAITARVNETAAAVWLINALFCADQVLYVRSLLERLRSADKWRFAKRLHCAASLVGLLLLLIGAAFSFLPLGAVIAYLPLLTRAWWMEPPLRRINLQSVGFRELALSLVSGVLLVGAFFIQGH